MKTDTQDQNEVAQMDPLTKQQIEYINLKASHDRMHTEFRRLYKAGEIQTCRTINTPKHLRDQDLPIVECLFYEYMELLQEQNNNLKTDGKV